LFAGWFRRVGGLLDSRLGGRSETILNFTGGWIDLNASVESPEFEHIARPVAAEAAEYVAA
jgi:hypothetical protein